jgi:hypothetical protein
VSGKSAGDLPGIEGIGWLYLAKESYPVWIQPLSLGTLTVDGIEIVQVHPFCSQQCQGCQVFCTAQRKRPRDITPLPVQVIGKLGQLGARRGVLSKEGDDENRITGRCLLVYGTATG